MQYCNDEVLMGMMGESVPSYARIGWLAVSSVDVSTIGGDPSPIRGWNSAWERR
jgi:hypothetical protein